MGKTSEPTPFETELAAFLGDASATAPLRDHATFRSIDPAITTPLQAAEDFARHLKAVAKARSERTKVRVHTSYSGAVTARVYGQGDRFHTIRFAEGAEGGLVARHRVAGGGALSAMLQGWLGASDRFTDIAWRTEAEVKGGEPGRPTPA